MDTIYNWLLQNTGNEGNYYTVLNTRRRTTTVGPGYFDVMVRTKDFIVLNLLIHDSPATGQEDIDPDHLHGKTQKDSYRFSSEQQAVDYLAEGKTPELADNKDSPIQILVLEPIDGSGDITFSPPN